jgi:hypothetical protein
LRVEIEGRQEKESREVEEMKSKLEAREQENSDLKTDIETLKSLL